MDLLHRKLKDKYHWYKKWHNHPWNDHFHWLILIFFVLLGAYFLKIVLTATGNVIAEQSLDKTPIEITTDHQITLDKQDNQPQKKSVKKATDRILVQFNPSTSDDKQKEIINSHNMMEKETIRGTKVKIIYLPSGSDPEMMVENLKKNDESFIDFAETDDLVTPAFIPNDTYFSNQWYLTKIEAPKAWDISPAKSTLIAICDTGVDGQHGDLASVLRADLGFNTVDNSNNWTPVHQHGTWVSGAAAAVVNNALGVAGVGYGAGIIPVRISNRSDGGAYLSDAAECITYSADFGARAINLSYEMAGSSTIDSAAVYAESKNAVTVLAAGNDGINPNWPDFSAFISVGATDQLDARADWSNYGDFIDLVAPGVSIYTTSTANQYAYASGTSLSAPTVAGSIALLYGAKPDSTVSEIKTALFTSAVDLGTAGDDSSYGNGRINVKRALENLLGVVATPNPDTVAPTVSVTYPTSKTRINPNSDLTITADASDNSGIRLVNFHVGLVTKLSGRQVSITNIFQCVDETNPYNCAWHVPNQTGTTYLIQAVAYDSAGNTGISKYVQFTVR